MTAAAHAPAITLHSVVKRFGAVEALRGVDVEIYAGRLSGIVGPDGAGKTTMMRIMAGLMSPDGGEVRLAGADLARERAQNDIGYMPQRFGLYEDLSVLENMRLYADLRAVDRRTHHEVFGRLFEFTKLGPFQERLAGKLSGGMKQKLGLACALMGSPKLLLLDEPSVGVDPVSRQDLWAMVQALIDDGMAVIWSTAYLDEAERCQSVILMNEGQKLFDGPPGDLTARLKDRSFRMTGMNEDRRLVLSRVLNLGSVCDGVIQGEAVRFVLKADAARDETDALAGSVGARVSPAQPRFEDAFVDLLGGGPSGSSPLAERMAPVTFAEEIAVQCRNLTKRFGDFVAARDVTFDVKKGEIFGLLGPNGAGKSTTFKMLCGLLKPTSGEARVIGRDLRTATGAVKAQLGYMAQKFSLYGLLSVRQNLNFYAGVYGLTGELRSERIAEMIETFGLDKYLDASPDELPLGYKQRLALSCALMHRPPILFLDEPTSGVDPITRREFWTHINGLARKGVTIMVTTHFMDEAEYCDTVALMYRGKLIALDPPDALKRQASRGPSDEPTMEDAFIRLIEAVDSEDDKARSAA